MAISNETFIDLEEALTKKLTRGWREQVETILREVDIALRAGDFPRAHKALDDLDLSELINRSEKYVRTILKASFLFGVSGVGDPKQSLADNDEVEAMLDNTVRQLRGMIKASLEDSVRDLGKEMVAQAEIELNAVKSEVVRKAVAMDTIEAFNKKMRQSGDARVAALAGLQNSRIASWGFTVEATLRGVSTYEVNEVMDSLTCPVCRRMDGETFEVEHAKQKLEQQLSVDDPAQLKEMAPWPKQDKTSLEEFKNLSKEELQARGWDTPPYHPGCRGVLRYKNTSVRVEDQTFTMTDILPSGSNLAAAMKVLDQQDRVDAFGKKDPTGAFIGIPFSVATGQVKDKVEAVSEQALLNTNPAQTVRLTRIVGLTASVDKSKVEGILRSGESPIPVVVRRNSRYYVVSGLEALVAAKLSGSSSAPVRVFKPE